jgi:hypothetical protein
MVFGADLWTQSRALRRPANFATFVAGFVLSLSVPSLADTAAPTEAEQKAMALYQEGLDLARQLRWKEAENRFERVVAIRSAPPALFALGRAEIENGKFATARVTLERASEDATPEYADVVSQAKDALQKLGPRIPRLELLLPPDAKDVVVTVDGSSLGTTALVELDCCVPHDIVVSARARRPFAAIVTVQEGERRRLQPVLVSERDGEQTPTPVTPARTETASAPAHHRDVVGPAILGTAGLALGVVGIVVRVVGQNDYDASKTACSGNPPRCPTSASDEVTRGNDARDRILAGTITAGVGVAALAAAGVWWALSGSSSQSSASPKLGVSGNATSVMASLRWKL